MTTIINISPQQFYALSLKQLQSFGITPADVIAPSVACGELGYQLEDIDDHLGELNDLLSSHWLENTGRYPFFAVRSFSTAGDIESKLNQLDCFVASYPRTKDIRLIIQSFLAEKGLKPTLPLTWQDTQ